MNDMASRGKRFGALGQALAALALTALLGGCMQGSSSEPAQETTSSAAPVAGVSQRSTMPQPRYNYANRPAPSVGVAAPAVVSRVVKVAVLVPLSGQSQPLGQALLDAAVLALFDKYATVSQQTGVQVEILSQDTKGTPEGAKAAAEAALAQGAALIVGPVFTPEVEAVAPLAKARGVNLISFSNNASLAAPNVYLFGFLPEQQVERVAQYALAGGVNRVALIAPDNAYGRKVGEVLVKLTAGMGRKLEPIVSYDPSAVTVTSSVNRLIEESSKSGGAPNFDALFIAEGGNKLGPILDALAAKNVTSRTKKFLGTGQWDDTELLRGVNLSGAWFASSPSEQYEAFEQRFSATYGYRPPRLASLAYDALALASTLALSGQDFSSATLADPGGFNGPANGIFRFNAKGGVERGLAVIEIGEAGLKVIDPAPQAFGR